MDKEATQELAHEIQLRLDRSNIPEYMHGGLILYLVHAVEPGGFLNAVLRNNLKEACVKADHINRDRLHDYVVFLYNEVPMNCWGSDEAVDAWQGLANCPG